MHQFFKFILFWNNTLHVLDGLSVHRQVFKVVHTATGICQTDTDTCLYGPMNVKPDPSSLYRSCWVVYVIQWLTVLTQLRVFLQDFFLRIQRDPVSQERSVWD